MQVKPTPSSGTSHCGENKDTDEQSVFNCVEPIVVDVVFVNIEHDILVREDDERVEKDPPSAQHQEIQNAEKDISALGEEIRAPGNGGDHRHGVEKEDDVKKKGIGDGTVKDDF